MTVADKLHGFKVTLEESKRYAVLSQNNPNEALSCIQLLQVAKD
jgi:hypothetical protein